MDKLPLLFAIDDRVLRITAAHLPVQPAKPLMNCMIDQYDIACQDCQTHRLIHSLHKRATNKQHHFLLRSQFAAIILIDFSQVLHNTFPLTRSHIMH